MNGYSQQYSTTIFVEIYTILMYDPVFCYLERSRYSVTEYHSGAEN